MVPSGERGTCFSCGAAVTRERATYHFTESGLTNVYLEDVEIVRCPACGVSPLIPALGPLTDAITDALLHGPARTELRFVRTAQGWALAEAAA